MPVIWGSTPNRGLSLRRVLAVKDFLIDECEVDPHQITGGGGVGEEWSRGNSVNDDPEWRSVEVIISNSAVRGQTFHIDGRPPQGTQFFIKYLGGGGGRPGLVLGLHRFVIRNPGDWYVPYTLGAAGGSLGFPYSQGGALPAGRGWVSFSTTSARTVESFDGRAYVRTSGAQVGPYGGSMFLLDMVGSGVGTLSLPTGSGFSLTLAEAMGGSFDVDLPRLRQSTDWRRI